MSSSFLCCQIRISVISAYKLLRGVARLIATPDDTYNGQLSLTLSFFHLNAVLAVLTVLLPLSFDKGSPCQ